MNGNNNNKINEYAATLKKLEDFAIGKSVEVAQARETLATALLSGSLNPRVGDFLIDAKIRAINKFLREQGQ